MITIVSGTNRLGSETLGVSRYVAGLYDSCGVPVEFLDLADLPPSLLSPLSYESEFEELTSFRQAMTGARGIVIVTPEYNGSFPGVLKLFIDHLPHPASLGGKPVACIGLSSGKWGGLRAVEHLQQVLLHREALLYPKRVLIPHIGDMFARGGECTEPELIDRLQEQVDGFAVFVEQVTRMRDGRDAAQVEEGR